MSVVSKEELLSRISSYIGEDNSDDAIQLLEDITDTANDFEAKSNVDWEKKYNDLETSYNDLDASWRNRYMERFKSKGEPSEGEPAIDKTQGSNPTPEPEVDPEPAEITIDDLFSEAV